MHKQALHLYNTDTESWKELSSKAERERELKMHRRFEEDRSFRRLSTNDGDDEGS